MDIRDCAAIVTGGASGLGAETARYLADAGAKVAVLDANADAVKVVAKRIGGLALHADVSDVKAVEAALAKARKAHGPARILVNCVGLAKPHRIVDYDGKPMPLDDFRHLVEVNLVGTFNVMRLVAADMAKLDPSLHGERGVILFTASVSAYEGQSGEAAYAASKGGIVSMVLPAARELGPLGIRVLAIAPGLFSTPVLFQLEQDMNVRLAESIPFPHRFGDPAEFAKLVLHVVDNVMINGTVLRIDGGRHD